MSTRPTDAELKAMWQLHAADIGGIFYYARAVLEKWGQPAQVVDCALEGERTVSRDGRTVEASVNPHRQPAPATQQAGEVRPVTPYTCPKCHALWLHWPAEQTGFGRDTLNCRSADHCHYCEKAGVEQLQRLERISAALHAPQPSPTVQAAESVPAPPPECETEAEKRAFAFGWFKALESERMKAESVQEDAARYRWLAASAGAVAGPDDIDAIALTRYKVVHSHDSMFHRFAVVAGDGKQQLYLGREAECENMARKLAGAFLDGAFYQSNIAPTPAAQAADSVQEDAARPDIDAAFEATRRCLCKIPRYSFALDSRGNVRRCEDKSGNWIEFDAAHALFDPVSVDAARKQGDQS
jgi:hypothetical protein